MDQPIYSLESCKGVKDKLELSWFSSTLPCNLLSDSLLSTKLSPNDLSLFAFVSDTSFDTDVSLSVSDAAKDDLDWV